MSPAAARSPSPCPSARPCCGLRRSADIRMSPRSPSPGPSARPCCGLRRSADSSPFRRAASPPAPDLPQRSSSVGRNSGRASPRIWVAEKENDPRDASARAHKVRSSSASRGGVAKTFMAPTISAASKAVAQSVTPRKKVLGARNNDPVVPSSPGDLAQCSKPRGPHPPLGGALDGASASSAAAPVTSHETAVVVPASQAEAPYDPKTNFLSPRPRFRFYKPNPRIMYRFEDDDSEEEEVTDAVLTPSPSPVRALPVPEKEVTDGPKKKSLWMRFLLPIALVLMAAAFVCMPLSTDYHPVMLNTTLSKASHFLSVQELHPGELAASLKQWSRRFLDVAMSYWKGKAIASYQEIDAVGSCIAANLSAAAATADSDADYAVGFYYSSAQTSPIGVEQDLGIDEVVSEPAVEMATFGEAEHIDEVEIEQVEVSGASSGEETAALIQVDKISNPAAVGAALAAFIVPAALAFFYMRQKLACVAANEPAEQVEGVEQGEQDGSGSSEGHIVAKGSQFRIAGTEEAERLGGAGASSRRDSTVQSTPFYGSFTTYEKISGKKGNKEDESMKLVRRSSRLRNAKSP